MMHVINAAFDNISNSDVMFIAGVIVISSFIFRYDKALAVLYACITGSIYWFLLKQINYIVSFILSFVTKHYYLPKEINLFGQIYSLSYENILNILSVAVIIFGCLIIGILANTSPVYRLRGAKLINSKFSWLSWIKGELRIGDVVLPKKLQTRSISVEGDVGVGKSEIILAIINFFRRKNHPGFCLDFGSEVAEKLSRPSDIVFDCKSEGINWSPYSEIKSDSDCHRVAAALVGRSSGSNQEWIGYAILFLAAIFMRSYKDNATNKELSHYLNGLSIEKLAQELKGLGIDRVFEKSAERMLTSILSVLSLSAMSLRLLNPNAGKDAISISETISMKSPKWIFVLYDARTSESSKELRRTLTMLVFDAVLCLAANKNYRFVVSIDELPTQGHLTGLDNFVALGRKRGLVAILGFQNRAQLREVYGNNVTDSILSCTGTKIILRTSEGSSAESISKEVGDEEIIRKQNPTSNGISQRPPKPEMRTVLLPPEIQSLPDLTALVKTAGDSPWVRTRIKIVSNKIKNVDISIHTSTSNMVADDSLDTNVVKDINVNKSKSSFDDV